MYCLSVHAALPICGGMVCSFAAPADMTTGGVPDQHSPPVVAPGSARGRLLLEFDHAVVPALTAVDDLGIARLGVDEQEEVVTDQLHPVERIVDGHRARRVLLLADHHGAAVRGHVVLRRSDERRVEKGYRAVI